MVTTQDNLASVMVATAASIAAYQRHTNGGPLPALATPEQVYAEMLAMDVLHHPAVAAAEAQTLAALRDHPNARSADGARTLERTVMLWTMNLVMQKVGQHMSPAFLIYADDTPHAWFGHAFPGVGVSGDNPDNIYRVAEIDGARRYEVTGQIPENPPAQLTVDLSHAMIGGGTANSKTSDLGTQIKLVKNEDLDIDAAGRFSITVGPEDGPGCHLKSVPGNLEIWARETKSDWRQPAIKLSIRCLDGVPSTVPVVATIAAEVAAQALEWCTRWATFRMNYLGRPPVNTVNPPVNRDGAWGLLAGGRWELDDDEAIIAVIDATGTQYIGVMLTDPWAIAFDARTTLSTRNTSQTHLHADGLATYVISARDPGVANWISTSGCTQGEIRFRWQRLSPAFDGARALRSYRKVAFKDIGAELPDLVGAVSPESRRAELARRAQEYDLRWMA